MICQKLSSLLGFECTEISEELACVNSPFSFDDGDALPLYVQVRGSQVRFFDDGGVMLHFLGRGMSFDDGRKTKFIKTAAEPHQVNFNDDGELEIWASIDTASTAFSKYLSTLISITSWERGQRGVNTDLTTLVDEVAMYLHAWKPEVELIKDPEFEGVSQQVYKLDFKFDGEAIVVTSAHPNAINSATHKLLDIRTAPQNGDLKLLVIIDDRSDEDAARRESMVIQAVANVMPLTTLKAHANRTYGGGAELPN